MSLSFPSAKWAPVLIQQAEHVFWALKKVCPPPEPVFKPAHHCYYLYIFDCSHQFTFYITHLDPSLYTKINALKIEKRSASSPLGKLSALRSHPHTHITRALPSSLQFTGSRSKVLNDLSRDPHWALGPCVHSVGGRGAERRGTRLESY